MQDTLTLALWQCTPLPLDVQANVQRLRPAAAQAAQQGADMLVCPEMFVTGYAIGADQVATLATDANAATNYLSDIAEIARAHQIAIVVGYPERGADGALYNAAMWFDAEGQRVWNYRKTHRFGTLDREQFSAGKIEQHAGSGQPLPTLKGWHIGLLICYDVEFPENTRRLALAGADLIVVPTANMAEFDFVATTLVPVRAYENQCFVAYANYCGPEATWTYGGLSTLAAADGTVSAQLGREPGMLVVQLQGAALQAARNTLSHVEDLSRL